MKILVLNLGGDRRLIISARTLISIIDHEDGKGSLIRYFEDTDKWVTREVLSKVPAADVILQGFEVAP